MNDELRKYKIEHKLPDFNPDFFLVSPGLWTDADFKESGNKPERLKY